jgi:hypothetical protein
VNAGVRTYAGCDVTPGTARTPISALLAALLAGISWLRLRARVRLGARARSR